MPSTTSRLVRWTRILPLFTTIFSLAESANPTQEPTSDPFYMIPQNISEYAAGEIIRSRPVTTFLSTLVTPITSYQVFYRTNDNLGDADATVATIWVPAIPANPPKVFSYQYAEDADNLDCAPSWAWVAGSAGNNSEVAEIEGPIVVPAGLNQGAYVVNPDAEGSKSAWLVGKTEGQACLDGIRATMNFFNLPESTTKVGMYGYSGAAHTTVWAASLAQTYAPELNIVGAAYGGTPTDLYSAYQLLNDGPSSLLAEGALIGLANGYPQLNSYLSTEQNSQGAQYESLLRSNNFCINSEQSPQYSDLNVSMFYNSDIFNPNSELMDVLRLESLLMNVSSIPVPVPKFPRYEYHGTNDTTVPYGPEAAYVQQQCAHGADIAFTSYPGLDHGEAAVTGLPGALNFLQQALNGTPPTIVCGTSLSS